MTFAPSSEFQGLDSTWTLYFHDPDDKDWTRNSYTNVCTICTAHEFWGVHAQLAEADAIGRGMWFVMREDVFPCWDDTTNIEGGCVSVMVNKPDVQRVWLSLCEAIMCECLRADGGNDVDEINGISVSPKNDFCIIKVWLRTDSLKPQDLRIVSNGLFTSNRSKIASSR